MSINVLKNAILRLADNKVVDGYETEFLSNSIGLVKSVFGLEQGDALLFNSKYQKANFLLSKEKSVPLVGEIKNCEIKTNPSDYENIFEPSALYEIGNFEALSRQKILYRKFPFEPFHLDILTHNFSKTPSVLIPLLNENNELIGFVHAFGRDSNSSLEVPQSVPIILRLTKGILEISIQLGTTRYENSLKQNLCEHLNITVERLEAEIITTKKNQYKLIEQSRQSGMSDVATGVLHNVGNVLNSINVSKSTIAKEISKLKIDSLRKISELLNKNKTQLDTYLGHDEIGKTLLPLLLAITEDLFEKRSKIEEELKTLSNNIQHVSSVISAQQTHAKSARNFESCSLISLVEDAVLMGIPREAENDIQIEHDFEPVPKIWVNRHKVLQILVNLVSNAKNALIESGKSNKKIRATLCRTGKDRVRISIQDNGVGIPVSILHAIFTQGFSTRRNGHGFGLHTSLTDAQQLGGKLWCESKGPGQGATFHLDLPIQFEPPPENFSEYQ